MRQDCKIRILRKQIFLLLFCFAITGNVLATECYFQQSFETAYKDSSAIFLGIALEETLVPASTKGGLDIGYVDVKFEVEKSWKLVNKRFVWIRVLARRIDSCGYNGLGVRYLVYANQLNDILFISPSSRTMSVNVAAYDLDKLGQGKIGITLGEFRILHSQVLIIVFVVGVILFILLLFYLISKRSISQF